MDKQLLVKVLGVASVAFGVVAAAAPDLLLTTYRFTPNPEARGMTRLWGTRNITLGALVLAAKGRELDDLLLSGSVLNGVDAVLGLAGNALDGTKGPGGALGGATSAVFGALCAYARGL
jgi:hypothetical protein